MMRRAAAMPAAPAPITTMSASRGSGARPRAPAEDRRDRKAADADRKSRRVIVMSWFPELEEMREQLANLPHLTCAQQHSW